MSPDVFDTILSDLFPGFDSFGSDVSALDQISGGLDGPCFKHQLLG